MRFISPEMFLDEWFGSLDPLQRLLWIGVITAVADDQGRFVNNPVLIRVKIFPYDPTITSEQIQAHLKSFQQAHKLVTYTFGLNGASKECMQILNWWKYQKHTRWAAPSPIPAPTGWTDRVFAHLAGHGTKPVSQNWDQPGGFTQEATQPLDSPITPAVHPLDSREEESEEEDKNEEEVKDEDESESSPPPTTTTACLAIFRALGASPSQIKYLEKTPGIKPEDIYAMAAQTWSNPKVRKHGFITCENILRGERSSADWYDQARWEGIPAQIRTQTGLVIQSQDKTEKQLGSVATRNSPEEEKAADYWSETIELLKPQISQREINAMIDLAGPLSYADGLMKLSVFTERSMQIFQERFESTVIRLLAGIANRQVQIEYVIKL